MLLNIFVSSLLIFFSTSPQSEPGVRFLLDGKGIKNSQVSISKMKKGNMKFELVEAPKVFEEEPYTVDFTLARDKKAVVHIDNHVIPEPFNLNEIAGSNGTELKAGDRLIFLFENVMSETSWIYQFDVVD